MELIDTHLHVINLDKLNYPWLAGDHPLNRNFPLADWQQQARRCGITSALHMEVDVAEADIAAETTMVEGFMAEASGMVIGAISSCRPEHADFERFLEGALAREAIKGFRRVLHVVPDEVSQQALFRENIKRLGRVKMPFDICVQPRQLPLAAALADCATNVQFVLDHCGCPDIKAHDYAPWAAEIKSLSRRSNVAVKISGISAYAGSRELKDLRPYVAHCLACFGWDRVVWGSDWPVVTQRASLPIWLSATHAIVSGASADEKSKLFSRNAKRIWNL